MIARALFSSATDEWSTPRDLFDRLNQEFRFTVDVCASASNALCPKFYTRENSCFSGVFYGETCFMNPPYCRREAACRPGCAKKRCAVRGWHRSTPLPGTGDYVTLAATASVTNASDWVCLLPARTDTQWWHQRVIPAASEIRFVKGRLKFGGAKNSAPFPSAIVIYRGRT